MNLRATVRKRLKNHILGDHTIITESMPGGSKKVTNIGARDCIVGGTFEVSTFSPEKQLPITWTQESEQNLLTWLKRPGAGFPR